MSDTQVLDELLALSALLQADQDRGLTALGLTTSRTHLLWVLHHDGRSTQRQISSAMGVTPRHVTTLVDELVATGWVTRDPHPTDRRAVLVSLTDRGRSTMEQMAQDHEAFATNLLAGLSSAQIRALHVGLRHLTERLSQLTAEAEDAR